MSHLSAGAGSSATMPAKIDNAAMSRNDRACVATQIDALRLVYLALFAEEFFHPIESRILRNSLIDCMDALEELIHPGSLAEEAHHG